MTIMPRVIRLLLLPALLCPLLAWAAVPAASVAAPAQAKSDAIAKDSAHDPKVERILRAMGNSSTVGHPDLFGRFTGMRCFASHDYACALKYFKYGAYYADKFSELALGLMYAHGNGVAKNPSTAWAWLSLSASRGYPEFVATRKRIGARLTPAQRKAGEVELATLEKTYGDKVAMPRMLSALRLAMMSDLTGSRLGFDQGVFTYSAHNFPTGPQLTPRGFGNLRDRWYWDPKDYFQQRDAQWGAGTVTVGALQQPAPAHASSVGKR
ncbi:MAG: sel1 repeat family protein [Metallibacterium sp.]